MSNFDLKIELTLQLKDKNKSQQNHIRYYLLTPNIKIQIPYRYINRPRG